MELYNQLHQKNISFRVLSGWSPYFHGRWEETFAGHLTVAEKKAIYLKDIGYYSGYLWHVFSFQKVEHLDRDQAIQAFREQSKNHCYVFYQHSDDVFRIEQGEKLSFDVLQGEEDIYLVDEDFTWTFVITHETETCGPYFARSVSKA